MEDLLEDEDEDFDKDDKVIMSRKNGHKKKKMVAHAAGGGRHAPGRKITHTHTQMNKMTSSPSLLSPSSPPRSANTERRVRNGSSQPFFILARVKKGTFPTFFLLGVCLF